MKTRLTPHYIDLVHDACLKSFWRKRALANFLRRCGIKDAFLGTWSPDETKRDLLDRLFDTLMRTDAGRQAFIRIARYLLEQDTFPDLDDWEDSTHKKKDAYDAISRLKLYHQKQDEEIKSEKERQKTKKEFRQQQEKITRSQQTLQSLSDRLNELGQQLGTQKAGYDFQDWFYDLLDFFEIDNRRPYVHEGRQIDGSLTISGTTYLVELKFTTDQAAVTDIVDLNRFNGQLISFNERNSETEGK